MIDKYKQDIPEEEYADFSAIERGETKFIVKHYTSVNSYFATNDFQENWMKHPTSNWSKF